MGQSSALKYTTARSQLAYVMGLINKGTMQDLQRITNIRNEWAHKRRPRLSDDKLKKNVMTLSTVRGTTQKVTDSNYMKFCRAAIMKCVTAIEDSTSEQSNQK